MGRRFSGWKKEDKKDNEHLIMEQISGKVKGIHCFCNVDQVSYIPHFSVKKLKQLTIHRTTNPILFHGIGTPI